MIYGPSVTRVQSRSICYLYVCMCVLL